MRKKYISALNVMACMAVVMLHSNVAFWTYSTESYWTSANVVESLMYFGVPVFFMVSGVTLMDYRERYSTSVFFKKRILKTLIPFLYWNFFRFISLVITGGIDIKNITLIRFFEMFINTEFMPIYWFFIPLFGVYLCIPILSGIPKGIRKKIFTYGTVLAFTLNIFIPFVCNIMEFTYEPKVSLVVFDGYIFYVVAGWLLDQYDLKVSIRAIIYFLSIIGLLLHIGGTEVLSRNAGEIVCTYKGYLNLPCTIYALGIFVFVKECFSKEIWQKKLRIINKAIRVIDNYTFSIYLIHLYFLWGFTHFFDLDTKSILYRIGMPFIIIPACMLTIWIVRKIPIIKHLLP